MISFGELEIVIVLTVFWVFGGAILLLNHYEVIAEIKKNRCKCRDEVKK